jgi:hypothetical protein
MTPPSRPKYNNRGGGEDDGEELKADWAGRCFGRRPDDGVDAHAGRNTARLALAAQLPASVLADLTGISISTAERWSQWAKRDWTVYVAERSAHHIPGAGR